MSQEARWLSPSITNIARIEIAAAVAYQCGGSGCTRWIHLHDAEGGVQSFLVLSGGNPTIELHHPSPNPNPANWSA